MKSGLVLLRDHHSLDNYIRTQALILTPIFRANGLFPALYGEPTYSNVIKALKDRAQSALDDGGYSESGFLFFRFWEEDGGVIASCGFACPDTFLPFPGIDDL